MLNIILFGPPGAGKGTQSDKLKERYNLIHLSTGEVIRDEMNRGTELGKLAAEQMQGGKLASDELVIGIIEKFIKENCLVHGVIYDGFPRTLPQAKAFDRMLAIHNESVTIMMALDVPDEEVIKRITERGKVSGRADDQSVDVIKNRIKVYNQQTAIVAKYYESQGKYQLIDGMGGIDAVFKRLCQAIDEVTK